VNSHIQLTCHSRNTRAIANLQKSAYRAWPTSSLLKIIRPRFGSSMPAKNWPDHLSVSNLALQCRCTARSGTKIEHAKLPNRCRSRNNRPANRNKWSVGAGRSRRSAEVRHGRKHVDGYHMYLTRIIHFWLPNDGTQRDCSDYAIH